MAKKDKAIYAPGELSRVREKLGVFDKEEADMLIKKLGGEVGYERNEDEDQVRQPTRRERVNVKIGDRPGRGSSKDRTRLPLDDEDTISEEPGKGKPRRKKEKEADSDDDPSVPLRVSYWDRVKMDKFAGQSEFDIKSSAQVFQSMISLFGDIPDYVSPIFVTRRMPEYYKRLEVLVLSTRTLFPRNNMRRNERMKKNAPLVYSILDVIRYWDIEKIASDFAKIQAHAKSARVSDFSNILRAIYKPLFVLERLDLDAHIRGAYKILYKLLYIENPSEAESKYQELIRTALTAFSGIRNNIRFLLFPLLLKSVSANYVPYEQFFVERKNRLMSFLNVTEDNQINPAAVAIQGDAKDLKSEDEPAKEETPEGQETAKEEEISEEEKARRAAEESEKKALERGLRTLEILFPKAGWDRLSSFPDLYPYFADVFSMKKGVVNIAPTDPMQQILVLMHILEELFFATRHVSFGAIPDSSGTIEELSAPLGAIINNWRYYIETSFGKEYIPRLLEYVRVLEGSHEERASMYNKKLITELHWLKRLYFLPFYKFESLIPPPFRKGDINPIYGEIKNLRKYFSAVAAGIEQGNRAGGAEAQAPCDGIGNPWEPYVFEVPNPLSRRLDALLAPKARNNAALIYFSLAVTTVLDHLLNNEKSWAYGSRPGPLFRSVNGEGAVPLTGVDNRIDADGIFKQTLKQRQKSKEA